MRGSLRLWLFALVSCGLLIAVRVFLFPSPTGAGLFLLFFGLPGTFVFVVARSAEGAGQLGVLVGLCASVVANAAFFLCLFLLISRRRKRQTDGAMPSLLAAHSIRPMPRD